MEHRPEKDQEGILRHQEISPGKEIENVRKTIVPHDDGQSADMEERRESLIPDKPLREEEEKDRR